MERGKPSPNISLLKQLDRKITPLIEQDSLRPGQLPKFIRLICQAFGQRKETPFGRGLTFYILDPELLVEILLNRCPYPEPVYLTIPKFLTELELRQQASGVSEIFRSKVDRGRLSLFLKAPSLVERLKQTGSPSLTMPVIETIVDASGSVPPERAAVSACKYVWEIIQREIPKQEGKTLPLDVSPRL